jgi:cbb3-type cytochrome oxidase subunit 3
MTLPALATVIVSLAFVGLIVWVLWPANKARLEALASIPFNDDEQPRDAPEQQR